MSLIANNHAAALAVLGDPVRRRIYDYVAGAQDAVGRDAVAGHTDIPRSTAAFHLERLAEAGLLSVEYRRLSGRTGPGSGRPAKLYRAVEEELVGSIPERHYELAGELLASAAERADRERTSMREAISAQARELGEDLGRENADLVRALDQCGYEPTADESGTVTLGNCPFHSLASRHTDLVCNANLSLVEGMVCGCADERTAHLVPRRGRCCVEVRAAAPDEARGRDASPHERESSP